MIRIFAWRVVFTCLSRSRRLALALALLISLSLALLLSPPLFFLIFQALLPRLVLVPYLAFYRYSLHVSLFPVSLSHSLLFLLFKQLRKKCVSDAFDILFAVE